MRLRWLAVPSLVLFCGCAGLDPAAPYREAAKRLIFTLDKVDPNLHVAFPLEQSKLVLRLTLGIDNPSQVRFTARSITGKISLDSDGSSHPIGQLAFAKGVDLKPASRTPVTVDLAFTHNDLKQSWSALKMVSTGARPGTWHLDGEVGLELMGLPMSMPLRVQKRASGL